ncbi:DUF29 family protein [Methylobacterium tarhaniae]|uniref:DUF29 family protein n=1 Tax=Methylobacterium tarhaniae TaxID=1187852 RepID=UPI00069F9D38|nr:DUF29 family protein [Methylobacterium tarhaniae]
MNETERRDLFSTDLSASAEEQACLAAGEVEAIDHAHIAEVDLRCDGRAITIDRRRRLVASRLDECPSLRPELPWLVAEVYPDAKARAVPESALFDDSFPESCPFTDEEILMHGFLPDSHGDDAVRGSDRWRREAAR